MSFRSWQGTNKVQVQNLEPMPGKRKVLERSTGVTRHLRTLTGAAFPAEATDIRRDTMPHETAFHISDGGIGTLMRKSMNALEDADDPGGGDDRARDGRGHVAEMVEPEGKGISCRESEVVVL